MHTMLRPLSAIHPLQDPILVAGFADSAGTTAAATVAYLVEHWDATLLAEIDPEEFFDFTVWRPSVRLENGEPALQWPTSRLYVARPAGAARDVVLLAGIEPHLRWRTFCEVIASFMRAVGATTSLLLSSHPGTTPHTRPVPVRLFASDETYARTFGLEPTTATHEGPTGIVGALTVQQRAQGFCTAILSTLTPYYVPREQNPHAMIALVEAIDRSLGTASPLAALREHAATLDREAAQAVRQSEPLRTVVQALEQQFDGIRGATATLPAPSQTASDLPSSDEVIAEIEQFLRQQRGPGASGPDGNTTLR